MARVIIVGDGPAGLSAALFLAKNDHEAVVYGTDETAVHYAYLYNYLGIEEIGGDDFQRIARGQVTRFGAELHDELVTEVSRDGDGFTVSLGEGDANRERTDYLIIAGGQQARKLISNLDVDVGDDGVEVDRQYATSAEGVYAVGRIARPRRSQAIISAGAGAVAALDIMAREAGRDVTDWDTPEDAAE